MADNGTSPKGPRCIALVGPFQSGKTTLLEAILARTGAIPRQGAVEAGSTVGDSSAEARFRREVRALGHVDHPNVVKAYTSGWEGEQWFFAMELIEGTDLASVCKHLADSAATEIGEERWRHAVTTACDLARTSEETLSEFRPVEQHVASEEVDPAATEPTPAESVASPAGSRASARARPRSTAVRPTRCPRTPGSASARSVAVGTARSPPASTAAISPDSW